MSILKYSQGINPLPAIQAAKITDSLSAAGINSILITSTYRTPAQQAAAMYTNAENTGITAQRTLYRAGNGGKVLDVYEQLKKTGKKKEIILSEMVKKIIQVNPETISAHCILDTTKNIAFDVAPDSIPAAQKGFFISAMKKITSKFLIPGVTTGEPVFHAEIREGFLKKAAIPGAGLLIGAAIFFLIYKGMK